jgi:transaldolase
MATSVAGARRRWRLRGGHSIAPESGIDVDALASQLQDEGAKAFVKSWHELLGVIASKSAALA